MERPELRTKRLHLRPMQADDVDRIVEYLSDFEVSKRLARAQHPYERRHALDWVARNQTSRLVDQTGFVLDAGQGLTGSIGFHLIEDIPNVGYWLAKPFWGQGLMSEAVRSVIAWMFEKSDHRLIRSGIFEGNEASLRIQENLGFKVIGTHKLHCLARGEDLPHLEMRLSRSRFDERQA